MRCCEAERTGEDLSTSRYVSYLAACKERTIYRAVHASTAQETRGVDASLMRWALCGLSLGEEPIALKLCFGENWRSAGRRCRKKGV